MPSWKAPEWKMQRNAAILKEVRQGAAPEILAARYRVLGICEPAAQRERFAHEHAESGGKARVRTLGSRN